MIGALGMKERLKCVEQFYNFNFSDLQKSLFSFIFFALKPLFLRVNRQYNFDIITRYERS